MPIVCVSIEGECTEKLEYLHYKSYKRCNEYKLDTIDDNNITRDIITYGLYTEESFLKTEKNNKTHNEMNRIFIPK